MAKQTDAKQTDAEKIVEVTTADLAAQNEALRAQLQALTDELSAKKSGGALVSAAELARMLGTDNPNVRQTEAQVHPGTGKPYFNDLRPTGRA
jgi:hypothetical protein